jgi:hypothetical protein
MLVTLVLLNLRIIPNRYFPGALPEGTRLSLLQNFGLDITYYYSATVDLFLVALSFFWTAAPDDFGTGDIE